MDDFLKKITGDKGKKSSSGGGGKKNNLKNPFGNLQIGGPKKFAGQGQSLGGSQPGEVISVSLPNQGSLGLKVEPTRQGGAIISSVQPGSQAAKAGLQRGDVVCLSNSEGEEEMKFDQFMAWASSDLRPFTFDVRRIEVVVGRGSGTTRRADDLTRRQAVVAAAEARDQAHRARTKTSGRSSYSPPRHTQHAFMTTTERQRMEAEQQQRLEDMAKQGPQSECSRRAVEAAKQQEAATVQRMGFNMYEVGKMTGDQAKNKTVDVKHGHVDAGVARSGGGGGGGAARTNHATAAPSHLSAPGIVRPPSSLPVSAADNNDNISSSFHQSIDEAFDEAFATVVSSSSNNTVKSVATMRKLVLNATTKGQSEDGAKFRRVRLTNDKIKQLIVDVPGALDLMMLFGFVPHEEGEETFLIYPLMDGDNGGGPDWMELGLERMERYEKQGE